MSRKMPFCTESTTTSAAAAADQCGGNPITAIHSDIIRTQILKRLDGATLASTSCASSQFLSLCSDDQFWRDICNSTWPSTTDTRVLRAISAFPSGHRSFYYDCFPSTSHQLPKKTRLSGTSELISAVDFYYKDQVIYSKVLETEMRTDDNRFSKHPLVLRLLDSTEMVPTPLRFEGDDSGCMSLAEEHLKVSWTVIDPTNKRAVNIVSLNHKAVASRLLEWNGDIQLDYAMVAAVDSWELVQCVVSVTCCRNEGGELHVKRVLMHVEDMAGRTVHGRECMRVLLAAMEGRRRRIDSEMDKDNYERFLRKKAQYRGDPRRLDYIREMRSIPQFLILLSKILILAAFCLVLASTCCYLARKDGSAGRVILPSTSLFLCLIFLNLFIEKVMMRLPELLCL